MGLSALPHTMLVEGTDEAPRLTFLYLEKKIKRITAEELLTATIMEQAGLTVRVVPAGSPTTLLTLTEYKQGFHTPSADPTLSPNTINAYKTKYKSILLEIDITEDPERRAYLQRQAAKLKATLGLKDKTSTNSEPDPYWTKEAIEKRMKEAAAKAIDAAIPDSDAALREIETQMRAEQEKAERESQQVRLQG